MASGAGVRRWGPWAGAAAGAVMAFGLAWRAQGQPDHATLRGLGHQLPDRVLPTDVLDSMTQAEEHLRVSDELGLPLVVDEVSAWCALGALAALVRVVDDGSRRALVVDLGGRRTPLARWSRALGFPVERELPSEPATVGLLGCIHPAGATSDGVDELLATAATALRPGGALVLTLPVGGAQVPGAVGRADLRALEARAHELGLLLVGDLDGETGRRLTDAVRGAHEDAPGRPLENAYALVRLTFRRR